MRTTRQEFNERRRLTSLAKEQTRNPKARTDRETGHPLETDTALGRTGPQHYAGEAKAPRLAPTGDPLTPPWRARVAQVAVRTVGTVKHLGQSK